MVQTVPSDARTGRSADQIIGREHELGLLLAPSDGTVQPIWYIHGIAGIGKTTLLRAAASQAQASGMTVLWLDGRLLEPTAKGFLEGLSRQYGEGVDLESLSARLGDSAIAIMIDNYESLTLIEVWLRESFVPALPPAVRLYFAAREPAGPLWRGDPQCGIRLRTLDLKPLDRVATQHLVARFGMVEDRARTIYHVTRGHPLATVLAASKLRDSAATVVDALVDVNLDLAQAYLSGAGDEGLREAIEAASVVRRVTMPMLARLLPHLPARETFAALRRLPFVDVVQDGLHIHELVRSAVAAALALSDAPRFRAYQRAAWHCAKAETRQCAPGDMWRYTADMIYLLRNPVIREAFFPSAATRFSVDRVQPGDHAAVAAIVRAHEPPAVVDLVGRWLARAPNAFLAVRDHDQRVVGLHWTYDPVRMDFALIERDPLARAWWARHRPNAKTARALFIRRWLSAEQGEAPSEIQAAAWLDMKRMYMEMRPALRWVYLTLTDPAPYAAVATELGFTLPDDGRIDIDGRTYHTAVLDMGPDSFDGWISRLLQAEIGQSTPDLLDEQSRRFTLRNCSVQLSPLEFSVMQRLHARDGLPAPRDELMAELWGEDYAGESNVLDAVIRQIRRKLGTNAHIVKTVRGIGYSLEA
ncbi:MAG TPA: winged helix-turn-helix domain-containing protein [Acetobacteraceae bacterium]|nr:winged helix-turn-helix domain-containing protein [Acetobacteraceae bacterium]